MAEDKNQSVQINPETTSPRKIVSVLDLTPRKMYRLHLHGVNEQDRTTVETGTKDFYIEENVTWDDQRLQQGGRIYVRIPNPKGINDLYGSFRMHELGYSIESDYKQRMHAERMENVSIVEIATAPRGRYDYEVPSAQSSEDRDFVNWVEEIGPLPKQKPR
jgi:hypothetical protein